MPSAAALVCFGAGVFHFAPQLDHSLFSTRLKKPDPHGVFKVIVNDLIFPLLAHRDR
jgi:hypothetical protein